MLLDKLQQKGYNRSRFSAAKEESMRCPVCKAKIPDHLSLCPECGEMVQDTRPMRAQRPKRPERTQQVVILSLIHI